MLLDGDRRLGFIAQRESSMPSDEELAALIDAAAPVLGIAVDPAWRDAIRTHLAIALGHGLSVAAFALPDEAEPAPVFVA